MIRNIVDNRMRRHRWEAINACVEPTWHDNAVTYSDRSEPAANERDYEQREKVSVADAIAWAQAFDFPVTLYLYDEGDDLR